MLEKFKFGVFFGFPGSKWIVSGKSFWTRLVGRTRIVTAGLVDLRVRVSGFLGILCYPYGVWVEVIGTSFLSLRPGLPPKDTEDRLVGSRIDRTSEANEDDVGATGDCKESNWSGCIVSSGRRCPTYNHAVPLYSITRRRTHSEEKKNKKKQHRRGGGGDIHARTRVSAILRIRLNIYMYNMRDTIGGRWLFL